MITAPKVELPNGLAAGSHKGHRRGGSDGSGTWGIFDDFSPKSYTEGASKSPGGV